MLADEIKRTYKQGGIVTQLIIVNVAIFLVMLLLGIFSKFTFTNLLLPFEWLTGTANLSDLLAKPWAAFTYMFLHADFWHVLGNMIWLYFLGKIYYDLVGARKFLSTYTLGGLSGFGLFVLIYNIFPYFSNVVDRSAIVGASAAVMAIVMAAAIYAPRMEINIFFFRIPLIWIALIKFLLDFAALQGESNLGGHIAHIGGAIYGYSYVSRLKRGQDIGEWFNILIDRFTGLFRKNKKLKVKYKKTPYSSTPPRDEYKYNEHKKAEQARIDEILDKISAKGYDSLTKEEKEFLFKAGKK
ncbi:MAG: rhomboid family intramembrane serine protease [Flavobacteriales bacterium]